MSRKPKIPWGYKMLHVWIRFVHNVLYYQKVYFLNTKNIPPAGTPLVVVSNHQNSLNDALGIVFSLSLRKPNFLARADVFKNSIAAKFLTYVGILPVYRKQDGMQNVKHNFRTFERAEDRIADGEIVVLYPEAGHQDKHFLGRFFLSYTRLAFDAAERSNFEKEVFILPSANHYSNYFKIQEQMLIVYGTPVSIKPFYDLYKEQPRKGQEEVNKIVRAQTESLMLHIEDEQYYDEIYYLLNSYGKVYAVKKGANPNKLPQKLEIDQQIVEFLNRAKEKNTEKIVTLYQETAEYKKGVEALKIADDAFEKDRGFWYLLAISLVLLIGLPLFLYGMLHHVIQYNAPKFINKKVKDKMLHSSFVIGLSALVTLPLFYILFFILCFVFTNIWIAIIYIVTLPFTAIYAWRYREWFFRWVQKCRYYCLKTKKSKELSKLQDLRKTIFTKMDEITSL